MRKTTTLGLLAGLLMLRMTSLAAAEGLVLCHSKQDRPGTIKITSEHGMLILLI